MSDSASYEAILVTAVRVHGDVFVPIVRDVTLPAHYQPLSGVMFAADFVEGICPIVAAVYDYDAGKMVVVAGASIVADAFNIDEWLMRNPDWRLATGYGATACTKCFQALSNGTAKIADWRAFAPDTTGMPLDVLPRMEQADDDDDDDNAIPWTPFDE